MSSIAARMLGSRRIGSRASADNTRSAAAGANLLNDWHVGRALLQRWLLIPCLVYCCMALGYGFIGLGRLGGGGTISAGEHLLVVGAPGLAVWIVMAVAGRMHSGWGLDRRNWVPIGAGLLLLAAILRTAAGWPIAGFATWLSASALLWIAVWIVYLANSARILIGPRPDGGHGCDEALPIV